MQEIVNKSDFYIDVELQDDDGVAIDLNSVDFKITHFTNNVILSATKVGSELTNCNIVNNTIRCYVDGFDFKFRGQLMEQAEITYPEVYPDNAQTIMSPIKPLDAIII